VIIPISTKASGLSATYSFLIYTAILLTQFQNISLRFFESTYDFTNFIFLIAINVLILFRKQKINHYIFFIIFIFVQIILWSFIQAAPIYRLFSGLVWFGGIVAIALFSYKGMYDKNFAFKIIYISMYFLAVHILIEGIIYKVDRPSAYLDEPSFAGLLLYGWAATILGKMTFQYVFHKKNNVTDAISLLLMLSAALLTKSMHVITFIIAAVVIFYSVGLKWRLLIQVMLLSVPLVGIFVWLFDPSHLLDRINVTDDITNISLLSWLRGFDQAWEAASTSPFLGYGLGSTGFIPFDSQYTETLAAFGLETMNLKDAYSGFFRLVIELGLFTTLAIIFLLQTHVKGIRLSNKNGINDYEAIVSKCLAIFGVTLLIGILIKEPTYSRSYVYLAVFLLATNWFGLAKTKI
jgi:hypothetical protein